MADEKKSTFDEINRRIEAANLTQFDAAAAKAGQVGQLCDIWRLVGPIICGLADLPFLPPKWRQAIKLFCDIMKTICPTA